MFAGRYCLPMRFGGSALELEFVSSHQAHDQPDGCEDQKEDGAQNDWTDQPSEELAELHPEPV